MSQNRDDRKTLVDFLQENAPRSFRAAELKLKTGVPKHLVRGLMQDVSSVTITEKPQGTFHYQSAKGKA